MIFSLVRAVSHMGEEKGTDFDVKIDDTYTARRSSIAGFADQEQCSSHHK